jgi:hypothetical protein
LRDAVFAEERIAQWQCRALARGWHDLVPGRVERLDDLLDERRVVRGYTAIESPTT